MLHVLDEFLEVCGTEAVPWAISYLKERVCEDEMSKAVQGSEHVIATIFAQCGCSEASVFVLCAGACVAAVASQQFGDLDKTRML